MVRCGAGASLNIEVCGAVRPPALDDGAVRCGCGPLRCGAVRSRAKLLGPCRLYPVGHGAPASVAGGIGRCVDRTLRFSGATGRLSATI